MAIKRPLPPAFLARANAVKAAHAHLAQTHPRWGALSSQERIKAVHAHIDRPQGGLAQVVTGWRMKQLKGT